MKKKAICFVIFLFAQHIVFGQAAATSNYNTLTGTLGSTYSWIDCSAGTSIVAGDDTRASILWPFTFNFYDNTYTTSDNLSVATNGFIRLDGIASKNYTSARNYSLSSTSTEFGQIIGLAVSDSKVGDNGGWVKSLVTGSEPNRIFTIEYNNLEIDYNDKKYADVQVSFYESTNKIVLKLGADNIGKNGVDMGLHSGINTFFNKWQEVKSGTNNTWIEYTHPNIEVNATIGTSIAYYSTLKSVFDKINDGTHQGDITIKLHISTTETSSAVLNASGSGSANYSSVNMYPTVTGLSINGNLSSALIDLNGADFVTIDGRVSATGSTPDLNIINTSITTNSTIRLINKATNNNIKYCTIKGSETQANGGVVFFSTTNSSVGNNDNTIEYNNITNSSDAYRPVNAIYSQGSAGKENSENTIRNNNVYDFFNHSSDSHGICLSSNTSDFTIDGNSFYETTTFAPTAAVTYYVVYMNNASTNGCSILNNYIGGSAPLCAGTAWTKTNASNDAFYGFYIAAGETSTHSIQNNILQNFSWSNSGVAPWIGMSISGGNANIGTLTGNTIGEETGTGSIELTSTSSSGTIDSYGIYIASTGTVYISNNSIGSVTTNTTASVPYSFGGIFKGGNVTGDLYVLNNLIGSLSTANSIQASTTVTGTTEQNVYGIRSDASGNTEMHGNTIANLFCAYNYASATNGQVAGIYTTNGVNEVTENIIRNLSSSSPSTDNNSHAAVIGISQQSSIAGQTVSRNAVYDLSSTYTGTRAVNVMGIYYYGGANGTNILSENLIHSLYLASTSPASTPSKITGLKIYSGSNQIYNNIITLGTSVTTGCSIYGIFENGNSTHTNKVYFNSVYIGGTISVETAPTYALYNLTDNSVRDIRNNVFFNARSGGSTGSHYAIRMAGTTITTIDYNDYFASGSNGVLGVYVNTDKTDLSSWQAATSQDVNSLNTNPNFTSAGGTNSSDYITSATLTGVTGTGITTDYDGITRNISPKMGALETSLSFVWQGNTSNDFATASNWENGFVPTDGADISFATTPANDCYLDQTRTLKNITNTSTKKLVVNGKQLTLTGNLVSATVNQIDASSASSIVVFDGTAVQSIASGVFVSNTIDALTLNNDHGLTQNGDLIVSTALTLTDGNYTIGANTLSINGTISITSGSLTGGSTSNIIIGGSGASATLPAVTINNLSLNRSNGIILGGDVTVSGTLNLTNGILTVGANTLTISGNSPTRVSGQMDASHSSATMEMKNTSSITCPESFFSSSINNLTIDGAGISACCSCTINGVLNLQSANPLSTMGTLDMGSDTLTMGANATTIGIGDVTGIVKREHTFVQNVKYSFGSQYTTFTFVDTNTKPTWICVKISIGSIPTWTPWDPSPNGKIQRQYQVSGSNNSSTSQASINMRYLLSELDPTFNNESKLIFWHKFTSYAGGLPHEHGKASQDLSNHSIGVVGLTFGAAASTNLDDSQVAIAYSLSTKNTWKGEVSGHETEWEQAQNWTAGNVPLSTDEVLIPGGLAYYPSFTASSNAVANSIEIETGASITANSYNLSVYGAGGAWDNHGTFYPGTGKVIFNHSVSSEIVTIAGTTNFYDIEVAANTTIQPVPGCILRIAGTGYADATSIIDFSSVDNTVEWNGTNQTIVNPNGIGGNSGYYKLILSGSGTKTMPTTAMNIADEFVLTGPLTATAQSVLTIGNELEILGGATFASGAFNHTVKGDFDVGGHQEEGTFVASPGTTITLNGTAMQKIYGGSEIEFENLIIDNSVGVDIFTDIVVNNGLTLSTGNLYVESTTLTLNGAITKTSGFIHTTTQSSLTFGGTTALTLPESLFFSTPIINNLTITRTGGVIASSDFTVNGILELSSNPSSSIGVLDMGTYTITMGENSTTTGVGDVTGIVKREHTFLPNTEYTFGSQYTSINFIDGNLTPTWVSVKISIGSVPAWIPWSPSPNGKVKRLYQLACSDNSSTAQTNVNMRYLLSELDPSYNDEHEIIFWHKSVSYASGAPHEHGKSTQDFTNHIIGLTGLIFGAVTTDDLDDSQLAMAYSLTVKNTWKGEVSGYETEWEQTQNWTGGHVPLSTEDVLIPGGLTYYPSLTSSANAVVKNIEIESGASITANSYNITVSGAGGAWINEGTFIPGTGTVIFDHGVSTEFVTVAGITNFYNIQIGANTTLVPVPGCTFRVAGAATGTPTSQADWSAVNSTVEWNGESQNINNPQGIGGHSGYYNLILSGSGTKTMPSSAMIIHGDFSTSGTASVTAADSIYVYGNTSIGSGSTFASGSETHILNGNFENNGTFTPTSGGTMMFHGTSSQTISGSSTTTFDGLCVNNLNDVSMLSNVNVNNELTILDGFLNVGSDTLGINGTINAVSGNVEVSTSSSLSFGGTSAITINNNVFNGDATINNLTINRSGGVTLGNESITIDGTLALTSGILAIGENTLTIAGNSPTRTSGTIDASNGACNLVFENASSITLPASIFSGNVNNLVVNGTGGIIASSDFTIDGELNLQSANPSSTLGSLDMNGYTLNMGANATTIGQGDVSGIIRRTSILPNTAYSFGNQNTIIYFEDVGTLPTELSLKVTLGSSPFWQSGTVLRVYDLIQTGGSGTQAFIQHHYQDSELNGNDENILGGWMYFFDSQQAIYYGTLSRNASENWVTTTNVHIGVFSSVFGETELCLDEYANTNITWNGSTSTSWTTATNWTPVGTPSDNTAITIPDAATTTHDPSIPEIAICGKMIIESGGILNSSSGGSLTLTGLSGAWENNGTFNPTTGTVIFTNDDETEMVTMDGTTNFYHLTLTDKTWLQPLTNCVINILGELNADSRCILDFDANPNTIAYLGSGAQSIIDPGLDHNYYNLSLGGSGEKTLLNDTLQIIGDFNLSGSATTTSYYELTVGADLILSNSSVLTIEAGKSLTVNGVISNSVGTAGLVLLSSNSGTASLIHNSDNVPATIQRYVSGNAEDWHFLSSPVSNQSISGSWIPSGTYGNGTGYDLYLWNEPNSCWIYHLNTTSTINWNTVHPGSNFEVGRGYLYSVEETTPTKEFVGNLNNGTLNYELTYSSADASLKGFNLIGNPYPSTIDWKAADGWTRTPLEISGGGYDVWVWNPDANNYGVYNSADADDTGTNSVGRYIAAMQGYFVLAAASGNLTTTNAVRFGDSSLSWFKNGSADKIAQDMEEMSISKVCLSVKSDAGYGSDEIRLKYGYSENKNGTQKLFSSVETAPSLYINSYNKHLSVNYLTNTKQNPFVTIMFTPGKTGRFTIDCDFNPDNYETVMLEDLKVDYIQNMKDLKTYRFTASVTDKANRFVLHLGPEMDHAEKEELPGRVYSNGNELIVDLTLVSKPTDIFIYDLMGRLLLQQNLPGEMQHYLALNCKTQILIIILKNPDGSFSYKLLWGVV